jgi:hypothetical protein
MIHDDNHHLLRAHFRSENQYESLRKALGIVLQCQGWKVCMHTTRFDGDSTGTGTVPETVTPSLNNTLETGRPDKFRKRKKGSKEKRDD